MKRGWHRTVASPACLCHTNTAKKIIKINGPDRAATGRASTQLPTEIGDMWKNKWMKKGLDVDLSETDYSSLFDPFWK